MVLGKLDHYLTPYTKINSKWIKDLDIRPETIKLLEENIGSEPLTSVLAIFWIWQSKNKWDYIKLKSFCAAKKTIKKMKMQPTDWEKIFANHISDKGLISKIYKVIQLNSKKKKKNHLKMGRGSKETFFTKKTCRWPANRHMERRSSLIREMQIKTTMKYHLIPVRMAVMKKTSNKCRQECGEKGTLVVFWWECKLVQPLWKQYGSSSKN